MRIAHYAIGYVLVGAAFAISCLFRRRKVQLRGEVILFVVFWPLCALLLPTLLGPRQDGPRTPGVSKATETRNEADDDNGTPA